MGPPIVGVGGCSIGERTADTSAETGSIVVEAETGGGGACGCDRLAATLEDRCNLASDTGDGFCCKRVEN